MRRHTLNVVLLSSASSSLCEESLLSSNIYLSRASMLTGVSDVMSSGSSDISAYRIDVNMAVLTAAINLASNNIVMSMGGIFVSITNSVSDIVQNSVNEANHCM